MTMSSADLDISVIVATRARSAGCRRLLRAIADQFSFFANIGYEIVLVFDGCPLYEWLPINEIPIRTVVLAEHSGIARARNAGIAAANGELLAFLDDDCVPASTWLAELVRMSAQYPQHVAFGGKVIGTDRHNLYSQLRDVVYYWETFGAWYLDPSATSDVIGGPYVNGGNSAYRRPSLVQAGGFEPILPAYSDVELGRRLHLACRAVLSPGMAILHDHPSGFRQYMLRCWRSGRARALLWAHRGYQQDSPATVARAVVTNILWNNIAHRRRRVDASAAVVVSVLLCQEVVHGIGYALTLARSRRRSGDRPGDRVDGPPDTRGVSG